MKGTVSQKGCKEKVMGCYSLGPNYESQLVFNFFLSAL
jgi:hypothetical protein